MLLAVAQVVGDVVVGAQLVGGVDAAVEQLGYGTVVFVVGAMVVLLQVLFGNLWASPGFLM